VFIGIPFLTYLNCSERICTIYQGDVSDEMAARLVRNRGPITAKISASGTHSRYCGASTQEGHDCSVQFSLVAWKFAGDEGEVHGLLEEKFNDGDGALKVDVDCLVRKDNEAIVGGKVREASDRHPVGKASGRRAYVKVVDDHDGGGDFVSNVHFDDGVASHCGTPGMEGNFKMDEGMNVEDARVGVCSKHGDWDGCLQKMKAEQAVVQEVS